MREITCLSLQQYNSRMSVYLSLLCYWTLNDSTVTSFKQIGMCVRLTAARERCLRLGYECVWFERPQQAVQNHFRQHETRFKRHRWALKRLGNINGSTNSE